MDGWMVCIRLVKQSSFSLIAPVASQLGAAATRTVPQSHPTTCSTTCLKQRANEDTTPSYLHTHTRSQPQHLLPMGTRRQNRGASPASLDRGHPVAAPPAAAAPCGCGPGLVWPPHAHSATRLAGHVIDCTAPPMRSAPLAGVIWRRAPVWPALHHICHSNEGPNVDCRQVVVAMNTTTLTFPTVQGPKQQYSYAGCECKAASKQALFLAKTSFKRNTLRQPKASPACPAHAVFPQPPPPPFGSTRPHCAQTAWYDWGDGTSRRVKRAHAAAAAACVLLRLHTSPRHLNGMPKWMDGWTDGWMDLRMGVWVSRWMTRV
jgi:hypothetical protein